MLPLCSTIGSSFSIILKVALQRYNILIVDMIATILKTVNDYNINSFASYNWEVLDQIFSAYSLKFWANWTNYFLTPQQ